MISFLKIDLNNRVFGLDVMRSLAVLLVLFGHYIEFFDAQLNAVIPATSISLRTFFNYFVNGFDGVDLFFVLSGFLIGHNLLKAYVEGKFNFNYLISNFWIKRWFRTLPNYLVSLLLTIAVGLLITKNLSGESVPFWKYFIFCQNLLKGELVFFPESWSLSVEEWFYLIFPVVLLIFSIAAQKQQKKQLALFICILLYIIIGSIMRFNYVASHTVENISTWNSDIRTSVIMRLDSIIYGVLMAFVKIYYPLEFKKYKTVFLLSGLAILFAGFYLVFISKDIVSAAKTAYSFYFSLVGTGMTLLIPFFYHLKTSRKRVLTLFTIISVISYSVYLVNFSLVMQPVETLIPGSGFGLSLFKLFLALLVTFVLSVMLYKFIETPFMNFRKRLLKE